MKILEIIETLGPGGAQRFVVDLSNELSQNHDVDILTLISKDNSEFYKEEINSRVKYHNYKGKTGLLHRLFQLIVTLNQIRRIKPDIVHLHDSAFIYGILPSIFLKKAKYFYTVHNMADKDAGNGIGAKLRKIFLKRNIKPITISDTCDYSFKQYFGFNSYRRIYNGCREIHTTNQLDNTIKEVSKYRVSSKSKIFLNIARLMEQKNHELLIESFNNIIDAGQDVILLIIGGYTSIERYQYLKSLIKYPKRIFLLGNKENIADYLYCSDIFCLSSKWEGLPITLLEAGLMGKYSICTPVGGIKEVLKSDDIGMTSNDLSEINFINMVLRAIDTVYNPTLIKQYFNQNFSMNKCAHEYISAFNEG